MNNNLLLPWAQWLVDHDCKWVIYISIYLLVPIALVLTIVTETVPELYTELKRAKCDIDDARKTDE